MKWHKEKEKWRFAVFPHQCLKCDDMFWLEKYVYHTTSYGNVKRYCKDCAQWVFPYIKKGGVDND